MSTLPIYKLKTFKFPVRFSKLNLTKHFCFLFLIPQILTSLYSSSIVGDYLTQRAKLTSLSTFMCKCTNPRAFKTDTDILTFFQIKISCLGLDYNSKKCCHSQSYPLYLGNRMKLFQLRRSSKSKNL